MDRNSLDNSRVAPAAPATSVALSGATGDSLTFPLPLSPFEDYMLTDDRASHPMVIVMLVDVRGSLNEQEFRESVREVLHAHPLLRCRIESIHGCNVWIPCETTPDPVQWEILTTGRPEERFPEVCPLNVRAGQGLRIHVYRGEHNARVILELHHCCCDGIAAVQLIGELFARYGQKSAPAASLQPEFAEPDANLLPLRTETPTENKAAPPARRSLTRLCGKIGRLLLRRPSRLADSRQRAAHAATGSTFQPHRQSIFFRTLSRDAYRAIRGVVVRHRVTFNDLLLREMLLHVRDWNSTAGIATPASWVRIAVPISMRSPMHADIPACNLVSYALVTHRMQECNQPENLLRVIHEKTSSLLSGREGLIALRLFALLRRIPGAMRCFLSQWACAGSLVLANVGDVRRRFRGRFPLQDGKWIAGNVIVDRIAGVSPVRPETLVALAVAEYAGEVTISLKTDGSVISREDSERFLDEFLDRLLSQIPATESQPATVSNSPAGSAGSQ